MQDEVADSQYVFELLDKPDDEDNDVSSGSDVDLEGYDVIDVYDSESSDEDVTPLLPPQKENKFKNQDHPRKLHSELWFNVEGEVRCHLSFLLRFLVPDFLHLGPVVRKPISLTLG